MSDGTGHGNRWALLIGINRYPLLAPRYQLKGCVNDVQLMSAVLRDNFGFPPQNVTALLDEEATREGILSALDGLVGRVSGGDVVVVFYSGHGSQMTDREGDEPDGLDETIVPHDGGRSPHPNRDITDDEVYEWLLRLTDVTPYVTLVFDSCHSGTVNRDLFGLRARWVEPDERPIEELPPSPVAHLPVRRAVRDLGPSGWLPPGKRYVLIAGCRDDESSYEHRLIQGGEEIVHGALTYFLCRELIRAERGATYRDVFERAGAQVTAVQPRQHPQIEGASDRELFGLRDVQPLRFVPVGRRVKGAVALGAGAAHGLSVGSRWAVYPQATKRVSEETARLGLVEITAVRAVTSEAGVVEEEKAGAIVEGSRAVEESHSYGEMRLVIDLQAPEGYAKAVDKLARLVKGSPLLRLSAPGEAADARVYVVAPRARADEGGPLPQLGAVGKATWAVVGLDGLLMLPARYLDDAEAIYILCDDLERVARYRQALALRNPENSPLTDKVEFTIKRQAANGSWILAEPVDKGGQVVFEEGERIAFEITNNYSLPVYISILDFGLTGAVSLLYPFQGASERLGPGRSLLVGVRSGEELELYLPDDFPYAPDPDDGDQPGGTETFKLFATSHEADFRPLLQEGYRGDDRSADTTLQYLLSLALTGQGFREVRRKAQPNEEWTAKERSLFLRRKAP